MFAGIKGHVNQSILWLWEYLIQLLNWSEFCYSESSVFRKQGLEDKTVF